MYLLRPIPSLTTKRASKSLYFYHITNLWIQLIPYFDKPGINLLGNLQQGSRKMVTSQVQAYHHYHYVLLL